MEDKPVIRRFFINFGIAFLIIAIKTKVISANPQIEDIKACLNTTAFAMPVAMLISIANVLVEGFYRGKIKQKIFKDDSTRP